MLGQHYRGQYIGQSRRSLLDRRTLCFGAFAAGMSGNRSLTVTARCPLKAGWPELAAPPRLVRT
jgi:hypothetical protein